MKALLLTLLLVFTADPVEIARINKLKKEAEAAFLAEDYKVAGEKYQFLADSLKLDEDEIHLNLGHCLYQLGDSTGANKYYESVSHSTNRELQSIAFQQLGVMAKKSMKLDESLQYLKSAIKANPGNEEARYNYEVVKKLVEEQKKQNQNQQDQQNKDQQNEDQQNKDQEKQDQQNKEKQEQENQDKNQEESEESEEQDKEGEKEESEQEGKEGEENKKDQESMDLSTKQKLEEMNISEEKAKMILEAMKNNEIQYIQQQKRKATQRPDSGKPDW